MGILGEIGSIVHLKKASNDNIQKSEAKTDETTKYEKETSFTSKEANEAISNNARAGINVDTSSKIKVCNTVNLTGSLFPDLDQKEITKDYLKMREEAKNKAVSTARKIYKTFTTGDLSPIKDKNGNITATFEIPKNEEGKFASDMEFCSFKMTEYNPKTKEVVAETRVFNHDGFNKHWKNHYAPYMERIEYGKNPKDTTFLRVTYTNKEANGKYILYSTVQTYAKGYQTDGKVTGMRKADKFMSKMLHQDYESYRTNYEAPAKLFNGALYTDPPSITEKGGMEGEKFDSALEYPMKQFKIGDEIFVFNPYFINEEGNRNKTEE